jgi:ADP-ribose pyrophosphatase
MADQSLDFPDSDDGLLEKTVESKLLHQGKFLTLKIDTVELPDGKHATREFVEHPGAVMILPLFDDGRVLLERQYRYPIAKVLLEYPAGKIDPNESELACAKRELQEETGYTAREWFLLTRIHPVISYSTEFIDLYLARGLTAGESKLDEGEFLELLSRTVADFPSGSGPAISATSRRSSAASGWRR